MPILINDFTRGALDNNSKISKHLHCPMVITLKNGKQIVKYKCKTLNWNVIQSENLRAETLDRNWSILIHCLMITSLQDWAQKSYPWSFQIGDLALVGILSKKKHVWPPGRGQRYIRKKLSDADKSAFVKLSAKLSISKNWNFEIIEKLSISKNASNLVR